MKLKKMEIKFNFLHKVILFLFIFVTFELNAKEKNYIVALVNENPITYIDLKEKAKFIHFSKNKNSNYQNLKHSYKEALEKLIEETILSAEAKKYNKNILDLAKIDSLKYLLSQFSNSEEKLEKFLMDTKLSKNILLMNIQIDLITKYIIQNQFKDEVKLIKREVKEEIKEVLKLYELDQIDLEEIIINYSDEDNYKGLIKNISFMLKNAFNFKDIINIYSKNSDYKIKGGRIGWKNSRQLPLNAFNNFMSKEEGDIIQFNEKNQIKLVRVLAKRIKGNLSDREKKISLVKINYAINKKNINKKLKVLQDSIMIHKKNLDCLDINKKINNIKGYESSFFVTRLADLNENIVRKIQGAEIKQVIEPFYLNNKALTFYICNIAYPKKAVPNKVNIQEKLLNKKFNILSLRLIKKLKRNSIIIIKKKF